MSILLGSIQQDMLQLRQAVQVMNVSTAEFARNTMPLPAEHVAVAESGGDVSSPPHLASLRQNLTFLGRGLLAANKRIKALVRLRSVPPWLLCTSTLNQVFGLGVVDYTVQMGHLSIYFNSFSFLTSSKAHTVQVCLNAGTWQREKFPHAV